MHQSNEYDISNVEMYRCPEGHKHLVLSIDVPDTWDNLALAELVKRLDDMLRKLGQDIKL